MMSAGDEQIVLLNKGKKRREANGMEKKREREGRGRAESLGR